MYVTARDESDEEVYPRLGSDVASVSARSQIGASTILYIPIVLKINRNDVST
jgi:hypothetical protein